MRLLWEVPDRNYSESMENIEAVVLLVHNEGGQGCFAAGPENLIYKAFSEGVFEWSIGSWEEEMKQAMTGVIVPFAREERDDALYITKNLASGEFGKVPNGSGSRFAIQGIKGEGAPNSLEVRNADDTLLFVVIGGKVKVGADGWGSEKKELMFFGAEILFNEEASKALRDAVYGVKTFETGDGKTMSVDMTRIMSEMVRARRANPAGRGGITLTAKAWAQLAEAEARRGDLPPSPN